MGTDLSRHRPERKRGELFGRSTLSLCRRRLRVEVLEDRRLLTCPVFQSGQPPADVEAEPLPVNDGSDSVIYGPQQVAESATPLLSGSLARPISQPSLPEYESGESPLDDAASGGADGPIGDRSPGAPSQQKEVHASRATSSVLASDTQDSLYGVVTNNRVVDILKINPSDGNQVVKFNNVFYADHTIGGLA